MKNALFALFALLCSLLLLQALKSNASLGRPHLRIGIIIPRSGPAADQGTWLTQGFELARSRLAKRSTLPIELFYEDSQGRTRDALSAFQRLKRAQNPQAYISWGSGIGLALSTPANMAKRVHIGVATSAPEYSSADDFTFRNFPTAAQESEFLAKEVRTTLRVKRLGILYINNDYGTSCMDTFRNRFEALGGIVEHTESVEPGQVDMRSQLLRLKARNVDSIYLASYYAEGALLLRQARELGLEVQFIASVAILGGEQFFELSRGAAEGLIIAVSAPHFQSSTRLGTQTFRRAFFTKYQQEPHAGHLYSARAYDTLMLLAAAGQHCEHNLEGSCLRDYLYTRKNYSGATGTLEFNRFGDVSAEFNLQQIRNGTFSPFSFATAH